MSSSDATLEVSHAPEGGYNWYCRRCDQAYDSLELLARINHDGEVRAALAELMRDPECKFPDYLRADGSVDEYINKLVIPRRRIARWSEICRSKWAQHKDLYALLAQKLHVAVHLLEPQVNALSGIGRWMHATSKESLSTELNVEAKTQLPTQNFRSCLAVPWCNARGRMAALWLLGWHEDVRMWYPGFVADTAGDPGVMLLDTLPTNPQRVIALSSPYLAIWLQYKQLQEDNRPAPVVAWSSSTSPEIWQRIGAQEVVFWDYVLSPEVLHQALNTPNSKVSYLSQPDFTIERQLGNIEHPDTWSALHSRMEAQQIPAGARIEDLTHRARDPMTACREYLLALPPEQISASLDILKLEAPQIEALVTQAPTAEERTHLDRIFTYACPQKSTMLHHGVVTQYIGPTASYWNYKKGRISNTVSDAVLQLDRAIYDSDRDNTVYTGVVHFRGKRYPMTATYDEIRTDTARLLVRTVEKGGGGTPRVVATFNKLLADAVFFFCNMERTEQALTRVGWDRDQGFQFPRFALRHGHIEAKQCYALDDYRYPARTVNMPEPLTDELLKPWLEPTEANGAAWALLAATLDNVLCRTGNRLPRAIGLMGSLAKTVAAKLRRDLDLVAFTAQSLKVDFHDFARAQVNHDMPVLVEGEPDDMPSTLLAWMCVPEPKTAIVPLSPLQATTAVLCGDWLIVDTNDDTGSYLNKSSLANLFVHFLSWAQVRPAPPVNSASTHTATLLREMREWVSVVSEANTAYVFNYAAKALQDPGTVSAAQRFLHLVAQLLHDGYLIRDYGTELRTRSAPIIIDRENKRVYIEKAKFVTAIRKRNMPIPDTERLTAQLREAGVLLGEAGPERAIWVIEEAAWENASRRWREIYALHET